MEIENNDVKGHQDGQGRKLTREEELNVIADYLASRALNEEGKEETKSHEINGQELIIHRKITTSDFAEERLHAA